MKEDEVSISVNIAGKNYPIRVSLSEKPLVEKASDLIRERFDDYQNNFLNLDNQSLVSMLCIELATELVKSKLVHQYSGVNNPNTDDVHKVNQLIDRILNKESITESI